MKRIHYLSLSILTLLLGSCSATSTLTLSVPQPSNVYLSKEVKNIGIVNRSIPSIKYNSLDVIDKILTAEEKNLDKNGAIETLKGLQETLAKNERFSNIVILDTLIFKDSGIDIFSPELSQNDIEKICTKNNLDAIYELSFYDTDAVVSYKTSNGTLPNSFGVKVPTLVHNISINTLIKSGWRIYDNVSKQLSDQYNTNKKFVVSGSGINPVKAFETIKNRKDEVFRMSREIGQNYALEIIPYTTRETRLYFVKGNSNFEKAQRRAQTGNWDGAGELWQIETNNSDDKLKGRAYYNMAIISEINGNLNKALDWASKSYADYGTKEALQYSKILKYRLQKSKQLEAEKL